MNMDKVLSVLQDQRGLAHGTFVAGNGYKCAVGALVAAAAGVDPRSIDDFYAHVRILEEEYGLSELDTDSLFRINDSEVPAGMSRKEHVIHQIKEEFSD